MTRRLPQSTAYTVVFKLFLSSDHVSPATGKTVAITLSKAGGAFGNPAAGASNATEISGGWYKFALGTGDTDTLGDLILVGTATACDTADIIMMVVSATSGGMTNLDAAVSSRLAPTTAGRTLDVSTGGEAGVDWANVGSPTTAVALSGTTISSAQVVASVSGAVGSVTGLTAANLDVAVSSRLAPTVAARTLDVSVGGEAGLDWANVGSPTTAVALSGTTISTAQVVASVSGAVGSVTGLTASRLDVNVSSRLAPTVAARTLDVSATGEAGLDWANVGGASSLVNLTNTTVSSTTTVGVVNNLADDSIDEFVLSAGGVAKIQTGLATSAAQTSMQTDVTAIRSKTDANLDATVSSRLAPTTAGRTLDVSTGGEAGVDWANVGGQSTTVNLSATSIASAGGGGSAPTAAQIADAVWDEVAAGHVTADSFGAVIDEIRVDVTGINTTTGNILDDTNDIQSTLASKLDVAVSSRLAPTAAGRTLDVTVNGEAGIDWGNLGNPTASQSLGNTVIGTSSVVGTVNDLATDAVDQLALSAGAVNKIVDGIINRSMGRGTVAAAATAINVPTSAFTPTGATADQFAGRAILFDLTTTTAALRGCARTITASSNAALPVLTVGVLPVAPASGDTFSVI